MMLCRKLLSLGRLSNRRWFLSAAHECNENWAAVRQSQLVKNVNPDQVFSHIERGMNRGEAPAAVDIDLLALSAAERGSHLSELRDSLHKMRLSGRASDLFDSTQYYTIRAFNDHHALEDLIEILEDRLNYGVFLCEFTASIMLNKLLLTGDIPNAARVSSLLMLQEDFMGPIPESLASYASYKYIQLVDVPEEPPPPPPTKKKVEEIKIRVGYLRNPFFDDHFDIRDLNLLSGKTLAKSYLNSNDLLDLNCKLLGWIFYKKYDKAKLVADALMKQKCIYNDTLTIAQKLSDVYQQRNKTEDAASVNELLTYLKTIPSKDVNIEDNMKNRINQAVAEDGDNFILRHQQVFDTWEKNRREKLRVYIEQLENAKREQAIKERDEKLKNIEEQIWFFDNEEKVDLQIENNRIYYPKRWHGVKKQSKTTESDDYNPPIFK